MLAPLRRQPVLPVANWQHVVRLARTGATGYTARVVEPKINSCWRKARIAARLLLKKEARRPWNARDRALAAKFARDDGVTNRLVDQAVKYLKAPL